MAAKKGNQNATKAEALKRSGYVLRVPLTDKERETVEKKSEAKGLTKAEYARLQLLR